MPVEWLEPMNQRQESLKGQETIRIVPDWKRPGIFKRYPIVADRTAHMRRRCVMGHSVHPSLKRTTMVESLQTPPNGDVDFLKQILPQRRVGFIGRSNALHGRAKIDGALRVQVRGL